MHRHSIMMAGVAAAGLSLGGCAIVQSTPEGTAKERVGLAYMLPKALLPVELVESSGALLLRVLPAQLVGDPSQRYLVHSPVNAFSSDQVKIEVDPATGLLTQVTATSVDESLNVLKELASSARAIRSAELSAQGEVVLFSGLYDPDGAVSSEAATRNGDMLIALQGTLAARVRLWKAECDKDASDTQKCDTVSRLLPPLERATAAQAPAAFIRISAQPLLSPDKTKPADSGADCGLGICHRSLQPFQIDLAIPGVFAQSTVVQLPNGGAPIVLPLDRAAFVTTQHTVVLTNGQVASHDVQRPSSALALVKWPLDVYKAALEATSTLIQLRIGDDAKAVELAQSQLTTETELKRIREELEALKPKVERSPGTAGRVTSGALVSAELGRRQPPPPPPAPPAPPAPRAPPAPQIGTPGPGQPAQPGQPRPSGMPSV